MFVLMALVGAMALPAIWSWIKAGMNKWPCMGNVVAGVVTVILLTSALAMSLRGHLSEYYYHVIDDEIYQEFLWVKEYVPPQYQIGVLDTNMAWSFAAITQKYAYTAEVAPNFHAEGRAAMKFLENGARDTSWLIERGIDMVYSPEPVENDELIKVNNNLYLLVGKRGKF